MARKKKEEITEEVQQAVETTAEQVAEVKTEKKRPRKYEGEYVVNGVSSWLNVRREAGKDKEIIGRLYNGGVVSCNGDYKKDGEGKIWLDVDAGSTFGFVMLDFLIKQ